jgi:hypothetical protein
MTALMLVKVAQPTIYRPSRPADRQCEESFTRSSWAAATVYMIRWHAKHDTRCAEWTKTSLPSAKE